MILDYNSIPNEFVTKPGRPVERRGTVRPFRYRIAVCRHRWYMPRDVRKGRKVAVEVQ
ncbi:MAG: hypothetical protein LBK13_07825 [Spirochaetales bacterium]|nr:hypothetical protein [Spirochaetales bacterium]